MPTENQSRAVASPPTVNHVCELTHKSIETLGMVTGEGTLSGSIERHKQGGEEITEYLELPTLSRQKPPVTPQYPINKTNQYLQQEFPLFA